jgi:hypothetical protein
MIGRKKQDETTAHALGVSYDFFVSRKRLLRRQTQNVRRGVFRILLPFVSEITRLRYSEARSRLLDRIIAGSER